MNIKRNLKSISALCGAALLTVSLAACGQQGAAGFIGLDAAKAIALENAGVAESAATFSATELDRQSGSGVYTIDFTANGQSYAYDIDALTGSILSGAPEAAGSSAGTAITAQQAQEIALNHTGLTADQVTLLRCALDREDGRQVYDVEFYNSASYIEYDYEIDASSGDILAYDFDVKHYTRPTDAGGNTSSGDTTTGNTGDTTDGNANTGSSNTGSTNTGSSNTGNTNPGSSGTASITAERAKQIALNHAGLSSSQVSFVRAHLDWEDGRRVYEVEFYNTSNYTEYDYEIDASSGNILSYDHEAEYYQRPSTGTGNSGNSGNTGTTSITEAQAQQIALSHAGLSSSQVSFIRSKLDWDDGRRVYDVEFYNTSNYTEYDYEIDAASGDILSYDHDAEYYQRPSTGTGSSGSSGGSAAISTEQAKQIALARVPGATDIRIHLDRDDGRLEYEGSIYYGSWEYEFTIDATTGAIREWERDSIYD